MAKQPSNNFSQTLPGTQPPRPKPGSLLSLGGDELFSGPDPYAGTSDQPAPVRRPTVRPNLNPLSMAASPSSAEPVTPPPARQSAGETLDAAYARYASAPIPKHLDAVLDAADGVIGAAVTSHGGGGGALVRGRARLIAAKAVKNYNPEAGAKLKSWLTTNLQELQRYRQQASPIRTPERVAIELGSVNRAANELREELGREPTDHELADRSHVGMRRLKHVRAYAKVQVGETPPSGADGEEADEYLPGVPDDHPDALWAELVYHDLEPVNKQVYDMLLGRGTADKKPMSVKAIAAKLGISSPAVSQRADRIARMLESGVELRGQF